VIRRLLLRDHPQETRFFLFVGVFGIVLAVVYWVLTYELAGSTLLLGFGFGAGLLGLALLRSRPRAVALAARRGAREEGSDPGSQLPEGMDPDVAGGGAGGIDTPFDDPSGRLPDETLAPLSLGLGLALAITALVFGPWLLVAGLLPLAWGAWTWLAGARDELDATVEDESLAASRARSLAPDDAEPAARAADATVRGTAGLPAGGEPRKT
jgi:hypothetical protein